MGKLVFHGGHLRYTILYQFWMFYYLHEHLHKMNLYIASL